MPRRLALNFSWLTLQEAVIRLIGLATAIYLARTLGAANYGALGLALALISFASVIVRAGTGSRATRITAQNPAAVPEVYSQISGLRLTMAAIIMTGIVVFAGPLGRSLSVPPLLLLLYCILLLRPAFTVFWAFRGLDRMHVTAIADSIEKTLTFLGLLLLVRGAGNDYLWAPVVEGFSILLVIVLLIRHLNGIYPGLRIRFRLREWPDMLREALPLSLATILGSFYVHGIVLLLGLMTTPDAAARFLVAQKVMLTLATLLFIANQAAFPSAARLTVSDPPAALKLATRLLHYYLVVIVPLFLLVAFHAPQVLGLLFGPDYTAGASVLVMLLAALPFLAINSVCHLLLRALPRPLAVLSASLTTTLLLVAVAAWRVPASGAAGAATAVVAGEVGGVALSLWLLWRAMGSVPLDRRCLAPVVAGAAAAGVYVLVTAWPLLLKLPLAAVVYCVLALLLKAVTWNELRTLPALFLPARGVADQASTSRQPPGTSG